MPGPMGGGMRGPGRRMQGGKRIENPGKVFKRLMAYIFKNYGTDSFIGLLTSIMMSCTETIFYTMSVYFLAAKVTKTRYTLAGALLSTLAGIAASVVLAGMM